MADRVYKCLNPVGIQDPVDFFPISPRLDKLDGKTIFFSIGAGGEQDIIIPLTKRLQSDYPQVNWQIRTAAEHRTIAGSSALSEEDMKIADACIRGVVWWHGAIWEQLPQLAAVEKAGIPMVLLIYPDQEDCFRQSTRLAGVPEMRTVHVSRTLPGPQDVDRFIRELMDALVRPLTTKEKEKTRWVENNDRILFEGTLEEAEVFYSRTERIPALENAIYFKYTDGLPVVIPTEERVAAMCKGTSHKPDEFLVFHANHNLDPRQLQMGRSGKKDDQCRFVPMKRRATVEKIAVIGVMAGCKPEHLPILLAMAEAGGGCGDGRAGDVFVLSGPIGREIGMNFNVNVMGPGSPNRVLGRAADLMFRNLGDNIPAVTNCGVWGHPVYNVVPENAQALPPGWKGVNEEYDFKKNESCIIVNRMGKGFSAEISQTMFSPGGYRAFQKSGHGGIARRMGVKGVPGPKNWMEYQLSSFWTGNETGYTFFMLPEMAQHLYQAGFKTKESFYEWMYKKSFMTLAEYRTHSWPDVNTNGWNGIEKQSGKHWKELPDEFMVPAMSDPYACMIVVTGGGEEVSLWTTGRGGGFDQAYSIDAWR